jgi:putative alpha-1,2-mannosidase
MICGGNGTRAQKCYYANRNTHRSTTNSAPNRATIESRLSSGTIALTANESLKMKTLEDSIYKDFAAAKVACHLATVF